MEFIKRVLENEVIRPTIPCGGWGSVMTSSVNPDQSKLAKYGRVIRCEASAVNSLKHLIWVCANCLSLFGGQLVFKILEHLL